jgi:hypothetical protein
MQKNFEILDAGLVCEDGAAVRFEIEYEYPKWFGSEFQWRAERGSISAGLELCFQALNKDSNEIWTTYSEDNGNIICELREQSWHLQPDANAGRTMPLGEWVAERVFQEGYSAAAEKIISYISKL